MSLVLFCHWENWDTEKLGDFPVVTQAGVELSCSWWGKRSHHRYTVPSLSVTQRHGLALILTEWVYWTDSWTKRKAARSPHGECDCAFLDVNWPAGILGLPESGLYYIWFVLLHLLLQDRGVHIGIQGKDVNKMWSLHWFIGITKRQQLDAKYSKRQRTPRCRHPLAPSSCLWPTGPPTLSRKLSVLPDLWAKPLGWLRPPCTFWPNLQLLSLLNFQKGCLSPSASSSLNPAWVPPPTTTFWFWKHSPMVTQVLNCCVVVFLIQILACPLNCANTLDCRMNCEALLHPNGPPKCYDFSIFLNASFYWNAYIIL